MLNRKFPLTRLRRLRSNSFIRDIVDENKITTDDLIQPIFVKDSDGIEEIDKMPNVFRYGLDVLVKEVREICELGIKSIAIFPVIDSSKRDAAGSEAFNENNLACSAIKLIKEHYPDPTDKTNKFVVVNVKIKKSFQTPVTLEKIKTEKKLSHISLVKQSRLSVMPIDKKSWNIICKMGGL